jgi:hypothetical protein
MSNAKSTCPVIKYTVALKREAMRDGNHHRILFDKGVNFI